MRRHFTKIVCIRFTQEDFDLIEKAGMETGYRGSVSKKIRKELEPMLDRLRNKKRDEECKQAARELGIGQNAKPAKAPKESLARQADRRIAKRLIGAKSK